MALLDTVKAALRISGTTFDTEVQNLIDACKSDLTESGVLKVSESDKLTIQAILTYCKANFGWDNTEADRFTASYSSIRDKMALASDYNQFAITFTVKHSNTAIKGATITIDTEDGAVVLMTNSLGIAIYFAYEGGIDIDYTVSAEGYADVTGSVYVDNDESVAVSV